MDNQSFFRTKFTLRRFPNPFFLRCTQEISVQRHNFSTNPLHILLMYKQTTDYISKRASQQAVRFLVSSRTLLQSATLCSSSYLSPQVGLREMRKKLRSTFFRFNHIPLVLESNPTFIYHGFFSEKTGSD